MPADAFLEESSNTRKIKPFKANLIAVIVAKRTAGSKSRERVAQLKKEIAKALEVTPTKVTQMLNNRSQPTTPQLTTIAQVLEVSLYDLFELEEAD